jgi:hypothetical protein
LAVRLHGCRLVLRLQTIRAALPRQIATVFPERKRRSYDSLYTAEAGEAQELLIVFSLSKNQARGYPVLLNENRRGGCNMTFFEWIRRCLLWDAEQHSLPAECRRELKRLLKEMRREEGNV